MRTRRGGGINCGTHCARLTVCVCVVLAGVVWCGTLSARGVGRFLIFSKYKL